MRGGECDDEGAFPEPNLLLVEACLGPLDRVQVLLFSNIARLLCTG